MSVIGKNGLGVAEIVQHLAKVESAVRKTVVLSLTPVEQVALYFALRYDWDLWARAKQRQPEGPWSYWVLAGGRGTGKTRVAAEAVIEWAMEPGTRIALVGRDSGNARKVMVDGDSGILACSPPWFKPRYYPSLKRLVWSNGSVAELHTSIEPDTLRGPQYHKAWVEELFHWRIPPKGKEPLAWVQGLRYGLRLGQNPQCIITSTPRSTEFCYDFLLGPRDEDGQRAIQPLSKDAENRHADGFPLSWRHETIVEVEGEKLPIRTYVVRWSTEENRANLSPGKPEEWRKEFGHSRLGQQELDGAILAKAIGALFSTQIIDDFAVDGLMRDGKQVRIIRTLVAVDPTRAESPTDEAGIIVGGLGDDGHVYVWDDLSGKYSPDRWARKALEAKNKYGASAIAYEKNRMPNTTMATIRSIDRSVQWIEVNAIENKQTRAEPVSAQYAQGKVHHVRDANDRTRTGRLSLLEDEMISWDPKERMPSPNRMDALVWLVTALIGTDARPPLAAA